MTLRRAAFLLAAPVLVLLGAACGDGSGPASQAASPAGRTFLSGSVSDGGAPRSLVEGTQLRLQITDDGRLTASAGCNTMVGDVDINGGRLVVGDLSTTEIGCDPARHQQDEWVAAFFAGDPSFTLQGDHLRLSGGDVTVDLIDRRVADPDRPLLGTTWTLDGIVDGQAAGTVPGGVVATVQLSAGRATVTVAGCNELSADVEVLGAGEAGRLRFDSLETTDMACGPPASLVEEAVAAVLDGTVVYDIQAASLTLTHPSGRGLMLRAGT